MTLNIKINSLPATIKASMNIETLLIEHGYKDKLVAVAVNGEFVPKSSYNSHIICNQDDIEIVAPMQGG